MYAPRAVAVGDGQKLLALLGPDGRERPPPAEPGGARSAGKATFVPDRPGLWQVKVEEGGAARLDPKLAFAALPDPRESDTRRLEPAELTAYFGGAVHARVAGDRPAGGEGRTVPLWSILLAIAVAAFLGEGLLLA